MLNESQVMDLLKLNYEVFSEGYNSRDRLVNDIFYRLIHVFQFFLIIVIISVGLTQGTYPNYHSICCAVIGFAGLLSMVSLLVSLEAFSSSKASLRDMCEKMDDVIFDQQTVKEINKSSNLLPIDGTFKYWYAIKNRRKYFEENFLKEERKSLFRIWASRILIIIWIVVVIVLATRNPKSDILSSVIDLLHLAGG